MFLALLVVASTLSVTIEKHFCGDYLIDTAIFTEAEKCSSDYSESEESEIVKKSCCKDEIEVLKGQDNLKSSDFEDLNPNQQKLLACFIYSYQSLFNYDNERTDSYENYLPPNLIRDISLMDQVFLI